MFDVGTMGTRAQIIINREVTLGTLGTRAPIDINLNRKFQDTC